MVTIKQIDCYGQEAVEEFWAAHQEGVGTARSGVSGRSNGDGQGDRGGGRTVSTERALAVEVALTHMTRGMASRPLRIVNVN